MSKLEAPIGRHLGEQVDEKTVQRIWGAVRARREGARFVRGRWPAWSWVALASLSLVVLAAVGWRHAHTQAAPVASGPLTSGAGAALAVLGGADASKDELSDGSSISLGAGAQLEVLENTSKTFVSVLRRGRGSFAVRPGGPRRWTIEAGLLTVEVVGTQFTVTRRETSVAVAVEHGIVLVRSELIADHVQRLTAGQTLSVELPVTTSATSATSAAAPVAPAPFESASARPVASVPSLPAGSLTSLLTDANELRRRGDVRGAEASLRRALSEHPNEPQTALVAFTLGKLLLDSLGRPADAVVAFERCLAAAPPSALAEDALFRLAQAQSQAGNAQAASASARRYQSSYPNGRHTGDVERWVIAP
jgi:transmembrane sensor